MRSPLSLRGVISHLSERKIIVRTEDDGSYTVTPQDQQRWPFENKNFKDLDDVYFQGLRMASRVEALCNVCVIAGRKAFMADQNRHIARAM